MLSNIYEAKYGGPLKKDVYVMNATIKLRYRSLHIQDTELMQIKVTVLHAEGHMYGLMIEELIIFITPEILNLIAYIACLLFLARLFFWGKKELLS